MEIRPIVGIPSITSLFNLVRRVARSETLKVAQKAIRATRRKAHSTIAEKTGYRVTPSRSDQRKIRNASKDRF